MEVALGTSRVRGPQASPEELPCPPPEQRGPGLRSSCRPVCSRHPRRPWPSGAPRLHPPAAHLHAGASSALWATPPPRAAGPGRRRRGHPCHLCGDRSEAPAPALCHCKAAGPRPAWPHPWRQGTVAPAPFLRTMLVRGVREGRDGWRKRLWAPRVSHPRPSHFEGLQAQTFPA